MYKTPESAVGHLNQLSCRCFDLVLEPLSAQTTDSRWNVVVKSRCVKICKTWRTDLNPGRLSRTLLIDPTVPPVPDRNSTTMDTDIIFWRRHFINRRTVTIVRICFGDWSGRVSFVKVRSMYCNLCPSLFHWYTKGIKRFRCFNYILWPSFCI